MDKTQRKKLSITLIILSLILCLFSGTLAYWTWEVNNSQKTNISLSVEGAQLTIEGGNVEKTGMHPTKLCNGEAALIGEVAEVTAINMSSSDMKAVIKIRATLTLTQGTFTSAKKAKINWAVVDTSAGTTCETTPYKGTMSSVTTNTDLETGIEYIISPISTVKKNYQIYAWLDWTYEHQNQGADITDPTQNLHISVKFSEKSELIQLDNDPEVPVLDEGMIPVKISADGVATTVSKTDETWYNYGNKEWANVVLVKNSGTQTRSYYKSNTGVTVNESDILAYYVWIPRYKYRIWTTTTSSTGKEQPIDIIFENADTTVTEGSQVGDFITHPAFIWDGEAIPGFWVGKFETGHSTLSGSTTVNNLGCSNENCTNADGLIIKPNVLSLKNNDISNYFYVSRSISRNSNPFGLTSTTTDTHMMKNSEWGAVAYLSHSLYGINQEIYINNSSSFYTGRSGGNVGGSTTSSTYGSYTWLGQSIDSFGTIGSYMADRTLGTNASTTGNVTGIYDMSGGAYDSVMSYYSGANSNYESDKSYFGWNSSTNDAGFTNQVDSKYWDEYTTTSNLTACNGSICLGHSLSEVAGWYSDSKTFISANFSWLMRGSYSGDSTSISGGLFYFYPTKGKASNSIGFRVVAIVEK